MCGLVGFTGERPADPGKIRVLLLENEVRGSHSTGMYGKRLMRKACQASDFVQDQNFDYIASAHQVIAHTRQSTGSAKTKQNAHPFMFGSKNSETLLIGAHNGSIFNEYEFENKIEGFKREDVDSASLYKMMYVTKDHEGFMMGEGHMALTFIFDGIVYLYRRESRPLFLGKTREGWYWSSIKSALRKIAIPEEKIYSLDPNVLLAFKGSRIVDRKKMPSPRVVLTEHQTSYTWDNGLSSELKEELTGKKLLPVASTGRTNTTTTNTRNTQEEEVTLESVKLAGWQTRIMSSSDLKAIQCPTLRGRNICLPLSTKLTAREYSDFILDTMKSYDLGLKIWPNYFSKDPSLPWWPAKAKTIIKADMQMFPQSADTLPDEFKNQTGVVVDIKPLLFDRLQNTLTTPNRQNLYLMVKMESDEFLKSSEYIGLEDAVSFMPLNNERKTEENDGCTKITIPSVVVNQFINPVIRLAVVDLINPGFMWETTVRLQRKSYYRFTMVLDERIEKEVLANIARGDHEKLNFSFKHEEDIHGIVAKQVLKEVVEARKSIVPLFIGDRTSRKESKSIFYCYRQIDKIVQDKKKLKEKEWDEDYASHYPPGSYTHKTYMESERTREYFERKMGWD